MVSQQSTFGVDSNSTMSDPSNLQDVRSQEIDQAIEKLLVRWSLASDTPLHPDDCPSEWQSLLAHLEASEISVAAIALMSHYQALLQVPTPSEPLVAMPILPQLAQPVLPSALTPIVHGLLEESENYILPTIRLLDDRGYVLAPVTWLHTHQQYTKNNKKYMTEAQMPANYRPWLAWLERQFRDTATSHVSTTLIDDNLNADNWSNFYPSERLEHLRRLRQQDATACRVLIEACVAQEAADKRVDIIATLGVDLSEADSEFLQILTTDRSKKVVAIANQLLTRLGHNTTNQEDIQELADMLSVKKTASLKQTLNHLVANSTKTPVKIVPVKLKNNVQEDRRTHLISHVDLVQLAKTLSISVETLIQRWALSDYPPQAVQGFMNQLALLPDKYLSATYPLMAWKDIQQYDITALWHRYTTAVQHDLALQMLLSFSYASEESLETIIVLFPRPIRDDELSWTTFTRSKLWQKMIKEDDINKLEKSCLAIGLLLPANIAEQALTTLMTITGRIRFDPIFNSLTLNVKLSERSSS